MITLLEDVTIYIDGEARDYVPMLQLSPVSDDEPADSIALEFPPCNLRLVIGTSELELALAMAKQEARRLDGDAWGE